MSINPKDLQLLIEKLESLSNKKVILKEHLVLLMKLLKRLKRKILNLASLIVVVSI